MNLSHIQMRFQTVLLTRTKTQKTLMHELTIEFIFLINTYGDNI